MTRAARLGAAAIIGLVTALAGLATPVDAAGFFSRKKPAAAAMPALDQTLSGIDQALAEGRLVDAGRLLDTTLAAGVTDPRLMLRAGELHLARNRDQEAVQSFTLAETAPACRARALQGKGIGLARLGRSDEAIAALQASVAADPSLWRAWNALGVEKDRRKDWLASEIAYAQALKSKDATAIVQNNRGYSRLLQGRYDEASADFVRALEKDPALASARTNLRLSLALRGDYRRAVAVSGNEERGAVLNNAGFAAAMRGDLAEAETLFQQAIDARGSTYGRAIANLQMVRALNKSAKPVVSQP
jgi:Flp pilus assembly protein TadD